MTNGSRSSESGIAVYLGLGSNVGDREANLKEARKRIENLGIEITRRSSIYETDPVGFADQPWFLNQVIEAKLPAELTSDGDHETIAAERAEALLSELLVIERNMGRKRTVANGPRVIDIDLLLFGDITIGHWKDDEELPLMKGTGIEVPHPRMHLRRFVLEPLCEIAPRLVHPVLKKTCRELLAKLDDASTVRLYNTVDDQSFFN